MEINLSETACLLYAHDNYLIITHRRPDGDTLGSAVALAAALKRVGKTAWLIKNSEITEKYIPYTKDYIADDNYHPEYYITIDCASEGMFCYEAKNYRTDSMLSIDHHPSNSRYAGNLLLDSCSASCGEVMYRLFLEMGITVDQELAVPLYIAVSTDTGCFSFANTTANTFNTAGALAETGINFQYLNRYLFNTKSRSRFLLEGRIMSGIEFFYGGKVAIITITQKMMTETGCTENDMDDIAAIPGSVHGVICGVTVRELATPGECKISLRSAPGFDCNSICAHFGGGGHMLASGASFKNTTAEKVKADLLDVFDSRFDELR